MGSDKFGGQNPWLGSKVVQGCKVAVNASKTWLWVGAETLSGLLNQSSRSSESRDMATGPSLHKLCTVDMLAVMPSLQKTSQNSVCAMY